MENISSIWGFEYLSQEHARIITHPDILDNVYSISDDGTIYSRLNGCYITHAIRNGKPYVNLLDKECVLHPHDIADLVACSFMDNYKDCIERGYHLSYIDGDMCNCKLKNLIFIGPK